jgi:putative transcriptional regulator
MSKAGESILRGARQALAYAQGERDGFVAHVPDALDVKAIRARLGLTRAAFAARFGFDLRAVENWEQGRRQPERPARAFLRVIEREPDAVMRALADRAGIPPPRATAFTHFIVLNQCSTVMAGLDPAIHVVPQHQHSRCG